MTIIDEKPVPLYMQTCSECGSTFIFKRGEVYCDMLKCPVCGIMQWASFQRLKGERKEETNGEDTNTI